jgi:hypothetical protein
MRERREAPQTAPSHLKKGHCSSLFVMPAKMPAAGEAGASLP